MADIDGYYIGYFTGASGSQGFGLFCLNNGLLVGADMAGVKFDGTYEPRPTSGYGGKVKVSAPPNITLVQGVFTGPSGMSYEVDLDVPATFPQDEVLKMITPLGPINVRMEFLRGLE